MESTEYWQYKYCKNCKKDCQKSNLEVFNCVVGKLSELIYETNDKSLDKEKIKPFTKNKKSTQYDLIFFNEE